jgi:hypothetical protein
MKKNLPIKSSFKLFAVVFILCLGYSNSAEARKLFGTETHSHFAFSCGGSGAYTMETQDTYIFGIQVSSRTVYRDGNGNEISDPC